MNKLEEAMKIFLDVKTILNERGEDFALAKAYKKSCRWYKEQGVSKAVQILEQEAKQN